MTHTRQELGARRVRSNDHFDRHGSKNTMATCASAGKKITTSTTTAKGLESDAYSNLFDEVQSSAAFNSTDHSSTRSGATSTSVCASAAEAMAARFVQKAWRAGPLKSSN